MTWSNEPIVCFTWTPPLEAKTNSWPSERVPLPFFICCCWEPWPQTALEEPNSLKVTAFRRQQPAKRGDKILRFSNLTQSSYLVHEHRKLYQRWGTQWSLTRTGNTRMWTQLLLWLYRNWIAYKSEPSTLLLKVIRLQIHKHIMCILQREIPTSFLRNSAKLKIWSNVHETKVRGFLLNIYSTNLNLEEIDAQAGIVCLI